jgi:hypothetical protein
MRNTFLLLLSLSILPLTSHAAQVDPPSLDLSPDPDDMDEVALSWVLIQEANRLVQYANECDTGSCSERGLLAAESYAEALYGKAVILDRHLAVFTSRSITETAEAYSARLVMRAARHALDITWGAGGGADPIPYEQWCCGWPTGTKPGNDDECNKWCCKWELGDPGQTCNDFDCTGTTSADCNFFSCSCAF